MAWVDSVWLKNKIITKVDSIHDKIINKLSSNENNIKTAIFNSETNIKNNDNSNRDSIKTSITNTQTAIINNDNSNKNTLANKVDGVKTVVDTVNTSLVNTKSVVDTIKTNTSNINTDLSNLSTKINTVNENINKVNIEVTEVKKQVVSGSDGNPIINLGELNSPVNIGNYHYSFHVYPTGILSSDPNHYPPEYTPAISMNVNVPLLIFYNDNCYIPTICRFLIITKKGETIYTNAYRLSQYYIANCYDIHIDGLTCIHYSYKHLGDGLRYDGYAAFYHTPLDKVYCEVYDNNGIFILSSYFNNFNKERECTVIHGDDTYTNYS